MPPGDGGRPRRRRHPGPGPSGIVIQPSSSVRGSVRMSVRIGFSPTSCSRIGSAYFGASGGTGRTARMWSVAASAIAPLQACGTANLPASPGGRRDLEDAADPATDRDVGLDEVERAGAQVRLRVRRRFEDLATGQRDRQLARQRRIRQVVVRRQRLLEPAEAELLERRTEPAAVGQVVGAVAVGHPGHRRGGRHDPLDRLDLLVHRVLADPELDRAEAVVERRSRLVRPGGLRRQAAEIAAARGVRTDLSPEPRAVQVGDGDPALTRPQVVERHRDRAERPAVRVGSRRQLGRGVVASDPTTESVIARAASTTPGTR